MLEYTQKYLDTLSYTKKYYNAIVRTTVLIYYQTTRTHYIVVKHPYSV